MFFLTSEETLYLDNMSFFFIQGSDGSVENKGNNIGNMGRCHINWYGATCDG